MIDQIDKDTVVEECYFCSNEAIYTDVADFQIVGICKKHMTNYYVS